MHHGWRGRVADRLTGMHTPLRPSPLPSDPGALPCQRLWWLLSPTGLGLPAAGLLGTAQEFIRALSGVAAARSGGGRYLVLAAHPGTGRLVGAWSWEARDG